MLVSRCCCLPNSAGLRRLVVSHTRAPPVPQAASSRPLGLKARAITSQAPASTADDGYILMYELADALEAAGEVSRALAVCMELQANAGQFRDVAERVDRLAKAQTGG